MRGALALQSVTSFSMEGLIFETLKVPSNFTNIQFIGVKQSENMIHNTTSIDNCTLSLLFFIPCVLIQFSWTVFLGEHDQERMTQKHALQKCDVKALACVRDMRDFDPPRQRCLSPVSVVR